MKLVKVLLASFLLVGLFAFTGCGKDKDYRAVTGTVTMGGAPLEGCILTFFPEDKETGEGGSAKTDASGAYSATSTGAENGGTGLKPGVYSVTAMKNEEVKNPDDEAFEKGETIEFPVTQSANHMPTCCNYWHVTFDTYSFDNPNIPIGSQDSSGSIKRILRLLRHDFLTLQGIVDIPEYDTIPSCFYYHDRRSIFKRKVIAFFKKHF